jgi:glycosyltransferase involved in cell wall biosynthesis
MEQQILFTVVMPSFNSQATVLATLQSFKNQTVSEGVELLFVDDGSSDESATMAETFGLPYLRVIRIPHGGIVAARNAGYDQAKGVFVGTWDADDLVSPYYFESILNLIRNFPSVDCFYGLMTSDLLYYRSYPKTLMTKAHPIATDDPFIAQMLLKCFSTSFRDCYRRSIIENHHLRDRPNVGWEDSLFGFSFLCFAQRVIFAPDMVWGWYRSNPNSITHSYLPGTSQFIINYSQALLSMYETSSLPKSVLVHYVAPNVVFHGVHYAFEREIYHPKGFIGKGRSLSSIRKLLRSPAICRCIHLLRLKDAPSKNAATLALMCKLGLFRLIDRYYRKKFNLSE